LFYLLLSQGYKKQMFAIVGPAYVTTHLASNQYAMLCVLDFSKAFGSIRYHAVLHKYSQLDIPDNIHNWIEAFSRGTHIAPKSTMRPPVSGKSRPASFRTIWHWTGLQYRHRRWHQAIQCINVLMAPYLVVSASISLSWAHAIDHVARWTEENNLLLNRSQSVEIVFISPRSQRSVVIPQPALHGFTRVDTVKILAVTFSRKFSVTQNVERLLSVSAQMLFALRTLRHHGMPASALHTVFQAIVVTKLSYASPARCRFTSKADRDRRESSLRRSVRHGYRDPADETRSDICGRADDKLFDNIIISRGDICGILSFRRSEVNIIRSVNALITFSYLLAYLSSVAVTL